MCEQNCAQDDAEVARYVAVSLGLTWAGGIGVDPRQLELLDNGQYKDKHYAIFRGEKVFIHPLLGSSKVKSK